MKHLAAFTFIALLSLESLATPCDQKFMNTLAANYLTLACNQDSKQETNACELKENYDDRTISSKRKLELDSSENFKSDSGNLTKYVSQIFNFLMGRNPALIVGKAVTYSTGAGGACDGGTNLRDPDGQSYNPFTFSNDKYVKKLNGASFCIPDYHPFDNPQIESLFKLSAQQQLKELKDPSTCRYYTTINRILKKLVQQNVEIDTKSSTKSPKLQKGTGRN